MDTLDTHRRSAIVVEVINLPFQAPGIYNYASFFPLLVAAILENIDFVHNRVEVLHRIGCSMRSSP